MRPLSLAGRACAGRLAVTAPAWLFAVAPAAARLVVMHGPAELTSAVLWIQTDSSAASMHKGEMARIGNNQMLACDVRTGDTRRFLTGPTHCEITGAAWTPDGTTMFLNVQHPGETPSERSDPAEPAKYSNWPDYKPGGRPRSATVVVRKKDGGVIGT